MADIERQEDFPDASSDHLQRINIHEVYSILVAQEFNDSGIDLGTLERSISDVELITLTFPRREIAAIKEDYEKLPLNGYQVRFSQATEDHTDVYTFRISFFGGEEPYVYSSDSIDLFKGVFAKVVRVLCASSALADHENERFSDSMVTLAPGE
ncbi:MAG: hypothetical protein AAFP80_15305 [Pseudomonadota bacterium]